MKKYLFFILVIVITSCYNHSNFEEYKQRVEENNEFKYNLINKQARALDLACSLMDKHNLWDKDGSDEMAEFLDIMSEVDSIYLSQQ